jgi:tRNA A-37 threonylcarbamoyl transferase component Bud32
MRGAEAVLRKATVLGMAAVVKERIAKGYREPSLDRRLRKERTRGEAKLLHKAKLAGVACPVVFEVEEFAITMGFLDGGRPDMDAGEAEEAGRMLAKLHEADIIHGDYTPANLIRSKPHQSDRRDPTASSGVCTHSVTTFQIGSQRAAGYQTQFGNGMLYVIDFGLGFVSNNVEDKAVDVFTMLRAIGEKEAFARGYGTYTKAGAVLARVKEVEKRVRYAF